MEAALFTDIMHHLSPTSSAQLNERGFAENHNLGHGTVHGVSYSADESHESKISPSLETPTKTTQKNTESPSHRVRFSSCLVTAVKTRPRTRTEEKPNLYWTANEIASIRCHEQGKDEKEMQFSNAIDESDFRCRTEGRDYNDVSIRLPFEMEDVSWYSSRSILQGREGTDNLSVEHFIQSDESDPSPITVAMADEEEKGPHLLGLLPSL